MIPQDFGEVSRRSVDKTVWNLLSLEEPYIRLEVGEVSGWNVHLDKNMVRKILAQHMCSHSSYVLLEPASSAIIYVLVF